MLSGKNRPLIIAHRGARNEAPENTVPAFQRAIELGADGIELDVLLTKDGVPVVAHNDDLSILTKSRGFIRETSFSELKNIDAGAHFDPSFRGTTMPTLMEALQVIGEHDIQTIVEIKEQPHLATHAAMVVGDVISGLKMRGPVITSSFSMRILFKLKRRFPAIKRALIVKRDAFFFFKTAFFARFAGLSSIHALHLALTPGIVERMHRQKRSVFAWTINTPEEFKKCISLGVDGIITNDVAAATKFFL